MPRCGVHSQYSMSAVESSEVMEKALTHAWGCLAQVAILLVLLQLPVHCQSRGCNRMLPLPDADPMCCECRSVMSSKASGEPSMMLSISVLYALRRAVAAARNSLSDAYPSAVLPKQLPALQHSTVLNSSASNTVMHSSPAGQMSTSYIIGNSQEEEEVAGSARPGISNGKSRGNAFLVLEAPVTTAHLKEAVGHFSIAEAIRAAAGRGRGTIAESRAEPEYHSSGEWVFVH